MSRSSWLQIDGVKRIDANDLDEKAAAAVRSNLEYNDPKASGLVRPTQGDVRLMALQVSPPFTFLVPLPDTSQAKELMSMKISSLSVCYQTKATKIAWSWGLADNLLMDSQ